MCLEYSILDMQIIIWRYQFALCYAIRSRIFISSKADDKYVVFDVPNLFMLDLLDS